MAEIAICVLAEVTRPAAEGRPDGPQARAVPDERERILVKLSLPRDALIEFVIRCRLGLGVEAALPGIRHLPQRWAASRRQARR